jgi:cytoskeletal protein RodZ
MLFEKKKINIETLSEYLSEVRLNLKLSEQQVCQKTGITPKFFAALESGNFKILPADVYVYGFLRQLASLYAISPEALIEQYKKERGIEQHIAKTNLKFSSTWRKKYFGRLVITPKIVSLGLGIAFVSLSVGYIVWQVWSINRMPSLQIIQPSNNAVVAGSFVQVQGKTDPGINVTVNGRIIFVDNSGGFQTQLALSPGPAEITVIAKNRFDKFLSKTISVTGEAAVSQENPAALQLKADFAAPVTLTFSIDSQPEQTLTFNKGDSKIFSAKQKILLSTSDAGATKITLNSQVLGPMGRQGEPLKDVPFFAPSASSSAVSK